MKTWLFQKIVGYLVEREGCKFDCEDTQSTETTSRTIVQDSFGFRYEVQVKVLGRIQNTGFDGDLLKTGSFLNTIVGLDV